MALRNQPYLPLYVQDIMTDEKLNECSASTHGIYIKGIMCLMHKSETYGKLLLKQKYKQSKKQSNNFACQLTKHLPYTVSELIDAIEELVNEQVCYFQGEYLCQKRMIKDNDISVKRSSAGKKGGDKTGNRFAKAKPQANTEDVNEDKDVSTDIIIKDKKIPTLTEFLDHGRILCEKAGRIYKDMVFPMEQKYQTWKDDDWKDGHGTPIKNWKNKLGNTLPHLKAINSNQQHGEQSRQSHQDSHDAIERYKLSHGDGQ